jgi:hypothetical protein
VNRPVTISADLAYELCDLLAGLSGFAEGVANVVPTLKATTEPLVVRAAAAADQIRQPLAESLADATLRGMRK